VCVCPHIDKREHALFDNLERHVEKIYFSIQDGVRGEVQESEFLIGNLEH